MQIRNVIEKHQVKLNHSFQYMWHYYPDSITLDDQEEACKTPRNAYLFAVLNIRGTDIAKCQKAACKDPYGAYYFAIFVPGADIEYCRKACESDKYFLNRLNKIIADKHANKKPNRKEPG